jgi:predicted N-acyltransferase
LDGVTVEMDFRGAKLDEFMDIYSSTMQRRMASESYFFSADFFRTIINELPGQYAFFHAIKEGRMISSELVLISVRYLYSFLGGTLSEAFACRPNDLLKHHIIQWGLETGKTAFVLGGGYGGPDGIFRYKRSFAPDGEVPFFINKMIWNEGLYKEIMEMRRKHEASKGITWVPRPAFFPEYRG